MYKEIQIVAPDYMRQLEETAHSEIIASVGVNSDVAQDPARQGGADAIYMGGALLSLMASAAVYRTVRSRSE